ncbi:MAG: hypothetical protein EBR09_12765 [Proteobacteria bacterium]|nr:hypothetical protein [Pseudomonadota bacterium]
MTTTTQQLWSGVFTEDTFEMTWQENQAVIAAGYGTTICVDPNAPVETVIATLSSSNPNITFELTSGYGLPFFYRLENGQLKRSTDEISWEWRARGYSMQDYLAITVTDGVSTDTLYLPGPLRLSRSPAVAAVYGYAPGSASGQVSVSQIYQDDWYAEYDFEPASRIVFDTLHGKTEQPFASVQFVDTTNYPTTGLKITADGHIGFTAQPALGQRSVKVRFANEMGTLDYLVTFTVVAGTSYPVNLVNQNYPGVFGGVSLDVICPRPEYLKTTNGVYFLGDAPAGSVVATLSTAFSGSASYSLTHPMFELVGNEIRKKESASWATSAEQQPVLELQVTVGEVTETCWIMVSIHRAPPAQVTPVAISNATIFPINEIPLETPNTDLNDSAGSCVVLTYLVNSALGFTASFIETSTYPTGDYTIWADTNTYLDTGVNLRGIRIKSASGAFTLGTHTVKVRLSNALGSTDHLVSFTVTEPPAAWATPTGPVTWKVVPERIHNLTQQEVWGGTIPNSIDVFIKTTDGLPPTVSVQGTKDTAVHNIDFSGGTYVVINGETFVATDFPVWPWQTIWPTNNSINGTDKLGLYRGKLYAKFVINQYNQFSLKLMNADRSVRKGELQFGRNGIGITIWEDIDNYNYTVTHGIYRTIPLYNQYVFAENVASESGNGGGNSGGGNSGGGDSGGGNSGGGDSGGGNSGGGGSGSESLNVVGTVVALASGKAVAAVAVNPTVVEILKNGQPLDAGSVVKNTATGQKFLKVEGGSMAFEPIEIVPRLDWGWPQEAAEVWEFLQEF